ncbi:DCC1-like thiol-disulfide oxidoreductase family protein [Halosolutus amylolyticus]|uniref:DCC1-like thiol-disulfide oxidoreductase family protein n=1 Tax=Halosolutus amylolyticus TaxID=2932267 RepID=A0ABD5PQZ3_9EURY|nr:DCC1-like thiol-disulfide oxidoreductase family protein [Halosolutus amylolyticus]
MPEPTLVYDDDCGFCTWWAEYVDELSDLRVVGFSDLTPDLRDRLPEYYEECAHLVTDDRVYSCGASIEEALRRVDRGGPVDDAVDFLRHFEDYRRFREGAYRFVADNRDLFGKVLSRTPPARRSRDER